MERFVRRNLTWLSNFFGSRIMRLATRPSVLRRVPPDFIMNVRGTTWDQRRLPFRSSASKFDWWNRLLPIFIYLSAQRVDTRSHRRPTWACCFRFLRNPRLPLLLTTGMVLLSCYTKVGVEWREPNISSLILSKVGSPSCSNEKISSTVRNS